jgi:hypothetical protein
MTSYIGSTIFVAAGVPATFDKAGYEALTWTAALGVQVVPVPGWDTSLIEVPDLTSGITKADKGASAGRESEMAFRRIEADAGQIALAGYAAPSAISEHSVKIVEPTGTNTHVYMSGLSYNLAENPGDSESHQGFTVTFRQNYAHVRTTAPA